MSIKPKRMVVTFDNPEEMKRISRLFTHYNSAFDSRWPFNIKPPVVVMFDIEYAITQIDQDYETIGLTDLNLAYLNGGRDTKPTLTVTLERINHEKLHQ